MDNQEDRLEIWKDLGMFYDIEISNLGGVRRMDSKTGEYVNPLVSLIGKTRVYGMFNAYNYVTKKQEKKYLHREVMRLFGPEPPENTNQVCFYDNNTLNCQIDNLYWSNQKERMKRRMNEGRYAIGEAHPLSILTEEKVYQIKKLHIEDNVQNCILAKMFGVHTSTISNVLHGRYWNHIVYEKNSK